MAVWRLIAHHDDPDTQIQAFLDLGWIAVGWTMTGDLRQANPASPGVIAQLITATWPDTSNAQLGGPSLWRFYREMCVGDLVILGDGNRRRAVVRVAGDYTFVPDGRAGAFLRYGHWRRAESVSCDAEALWQACGAGFANGENNRWTLARCAGALG